MASLPQNTAYVHKDGPAKVSALGVGGVEPQTPVTVNAAVAAISGGESPTEAEFNALLALVNQLRAALVANGICAAA